MRVQAGMVGALIIVVGVTLAVLETSGSASPGAATPTLPPELLEFAPEWVEESVSDDGTYVIEIETRKAWRLAQPNHLRPEVASTRIVGWAPDGRAIVELSIRLKDSTWTTYHAAVPGERFEPFREDLLLSSAQFLWAPNGRKYAVSGWSESAGASQTEVFEEGRYHEGMQGRVSEWSANGRFLTVGGSSVGGGFTLAVWDSQTPSEGTAPSIYAGSSTWSNHGARLAYVPGSAGWSDEDEPSLIRIRDFANGGDVLLAEIDTRYLDRLYWSPNDEYVAVSYGEGPPAYGTTTIIFDVSEAKPVVKVTAAAAAGWSGSGELLVSGGRCSDMDIYGVRPEGRGGLRNYTDSNRIELAGSLSPAQDRLAFSAHTRDQEAVGVLDLSDGTIQDLRLMSARGLEVGGWSRDGRYLSFSYGHGHGLCEGEPPDVKTEVEFLP